ncbi:hypothetical protein FH972_002529 [Carpinus fangiana]|uniref:Uncharacterized protein n=1 Tax=Carpinus fangiana TaxID=176857 RepID=A0A5N6QI92_9ROSI|nr:hypothetical protein FH972_002529 [Carpinus fangiana]
MSMKNSNGVFGSTFGIEHSTGAPCGGWVDNVPSKCFRLTIKSFSIQIVAVQIAGGWVKKTEFTRSILIIKNIA